MRSVRSLLMIAVVVASCVARAQAPGPVPFFLNLDQIEAIVTEKNLRSVEEVLQQLPPGNMANYVMVYESRSLQAASHDRPRVILRTPDTNLILTFNAGVDAAGKLLRGGQMLEAIEFKPDQQTFNFHSFVFDPNKAAPARLVRNIKTCNACHGVDPRPNFSAYFHWVGMFGSMDDFLSDIKDGHKYTDTGFRRDGNPDSSFDPNQGAIVQREHDAIRENFAFWKSHQRYSLLGEMQNFDNGDAFSRAHFTPRPNIQMQANLMRLNMERVMRLVMSSPDYAAYRFAILGSLACDADWPVNSSKYFPEDYQLAHALKINIQDLAKFNPSTGDWDPFFWIFEQRDISTRAWEMVYRNHYPTVKDPFFDGASGGINNRDITYRYVAWLLVQRDAEIKALIDAVPVKDSNIFSFQVYDKFSDSLCGQIRQRSTAALTELWAAKPVQRGLFQRQISRTESELFQYIGK